MKKVMIFVLALLVVFSSGCKKQTGDQVNLSKVSINTDGSLHIEGSGRAFENTIGIEVKDDNGLQLFRGAVVTDSGDMSKVGNFKEDINLNAFPQTDNVTVMAFTASAKDGSITASSEKKINYSMPYQTVKVYYGNTKLNPEMIDCSKVFPVERRIGSNSKNKALDTLKIFLLGPTTKEKDDGYIMTTPQDLTINKIEQTGSNKVQVDFGEELLNASGGSCKVTAIRAEITNTVAQFYPGYEVIISANGNVDEVLQP